MDEANTLPAPMLPEAQRNYGHEMTCRYGGTRNGEGEHRCTRCGRKPEDTLTATAPVMTGALATKLEPVARREDAEPALKTRRAPNLARAIQAELFAARPESNVVSI